LTWHCLDRVVPEGMSQVWRRSEVGNHKRRTLNPQLSSGTYEHTSSSSRNVPGRMIRTNFFSYWNNVKMKPTYRGMNLADYLIGGFRSTLKAGLGFVETNVRIQWNPVYKAFHRICLCGNERSGSSNSNVILTRQTCGHSSSKVAGSKRRALVFYFCVQIWYTIMICS